MFAWAKEEYGRLPFQGNAYSGFLRRELDNAVILSYRRYGSGQEIFHRLREHCRGDLVAAMRFVEKLGWVELPRKRRREIAPLD